MLAWVNIESKAKMPRVDDVIWVMSRIGNDSPARCRFIYSFIVDKEPLEDNGQIRFEGRSGLWLSDSQLISDVEWFKEFFREMGNGGTSIRPIREVYVEKLQALYGKIALAKNSSSDLEVEADLNKWPEDAIRFRSIKERRGQADFRARLLQAYGGRCCISNCKVEALLEAAHIRPHAIEPNYDTRNGLLLRSDLHTLFDLHLLGVDKFGAIRLSPEVNDAYYKDLVQKHNRINPPNKSDDRPSEDDLQARMELFRRGN